MNALSTCTLQPGNASKWNASNSSHSMANQDRFKFKVHQCTLLSHWPCSPFSILRLVLDCSKSWKEWSMLKWQTALQHSMLREVGAQSDLATRSTQSTLPLQTRSRLLTEEAVQAYLFALYLQKTAELVAHMKCPWTGMSELLMKCCPSADGD